MTKNLIGGIYGCRTVIGGSVRKNYETYWLCQCLCGKESYVKQNRLLRSGEGSTCKCKGTRTSIVDWCDDPEKWRDFIRDFVSKEEAKNLGSKYYGRVYCHKCDSEELWCYCGCYGCEKRRQRLLISNSLRSRLGEMYKKIGRKRPRNKFSDLMGCDTQTLGEHVESLFHDHPITGIAMSYENRGMYGVPERWQLDHVKPMKDFDLTNKNAVLEVCNYKNIMPTWSVVHMQKTNCENHGQHESLEEIWKRINE